MKVYVKYLQQWKLLSVILLVLVSFSAHAESTAQAVDYKKGFLDIFILSVCVFMVLALLFLLYILKVMIDYTKPASARKPLLSNLFHKLSDGVPIEHEGGILTDHEYDGIRELDNNLPLWWKYMFYATIITSVIYMYYYHFSGTDHLQIAEYNEEVATGNKEVAEYMKLSANGVDENSVKVLTDAKRIESGKVIFLQNCSACHGKGGEGGVGPNLTDEYWLHGGGVKSIFKTIKYGVPEKGMISWKTQLSPGNIQEVSSYILTLKGSNPANAKAPQGDKYVGD